MYDIPSNKKGGNAAMARICPIHMMFKTCRSNVSLSQVIWCTVINPSAGNNVPETAFRKWIGSTKRVLDGRIVGDLKPVSEQTPAVQQENANLPLLPVTHDFWSKLCPLNLFRSEVGEGKAAIFRQSRRPRSHFLVVVWDLRFPLLAGTWNGMGPGCPELNRISANNERCGDD